MSDREKHQQLRIVSVRRAEPDLRLLAAVLLALVAQRPADPTPPPEDVS